MTGSRWNRRTKTYACVRVLSRFPPPPHDDALDVAGGVLCAIGVGQVERGLDKSVADVERAFVCRICFSPSSFWPDGISGYTGPPHSYQSELEPGAWGEELTRQHAVRQRTELHMALTSARRRVEERLQVIDGPSCVLWLRFFPKTKTRQHIHRPFKTLVGSSR